MAAEPCIAKMCDARYVSHHEACNDLFAGFRALFHGEALAGAIVRFFRYDSILSEKYMPNDAVKIPKPRKIFVCSKNSHWNNQTFLLQ
jgi:hypothetical protein